MKRLNPTNACRYLGALVLACAASSWGEGVFSFNNAGFNVSPRAPIYGPDPDNPNLQKWGNATNAAPPGTQTYLGQGLTGTNYSVGAWYSTNAASDLFQLLPGASPVAGSLAHFKPPAAAGVFVDGEPSIPDPLLNTGPGGYRYYVYLQVRAWDNAGGELPTWADAWNAALSGGGGEPVGWSKVFYQGLDDPNNYSGPRLGIVNFESFNIFIVPEPAPISLVLFGAAGLWLLSGRRR
jgi:hypothetical protein